jgi:DNA-binding IclR family transcriptional regulator
VTAAEPLPPTPEYGPVPQYPIDSIDNALRVLLLFGEQPMLRMTDVSRYLGVASSTAHRLLAMLQYRGFVRQDAATRGYLPGPQLDGLAYQLLRRLDVRTIARPVLERLNTELQETIHLGRLDGTDVHFIESIESTRALRVGGRLGKSMPAHCTSTGKVLLAQLPQEELRRLYPEQKLVQLTPNSIGTRSALLKALATIRTQGWAGSSEESEEGVGSLAVALHAAGPARLAVNASMPISRMTEQTRRSVLVALIAAAEELDQIVM